MRFVSPNRTNLFFAYYLISHLIFVVAMREFRIATHYFCSQIAEQVCSY